jgi:class 3 adenylate cyclase
VTLCANCSHENREGAKYCEECAAPLAVIPASRAQRKTVTVLFCDVTGSTELGESTDPEALRALLARYFERMKGIVESHGGTVEKFIGDAVMAVFGVPQVHEDDALRAVRAAVEMRDALPELGVQARIGVNTGEVVTGTEERLATGDAVNVAARLEQAAQPGEILIGSDTLQLVREAVKVEPVEPLELKGKAEPVPAYRLEAVHEAPARSHEARFVGRANELEELRRAWQRVCAGPVCELATVVGEAGVGKSRLVDEALRSMSGRIVRGRCLPYGEGITYWPVVEVLKQLDALPSDQAAAVSIRSLLGESEEVTSAEEIAWAVRKLLQEQAPLVVVFDDIQWAEETFLDLVEGAALLIGDAPLLLLCMARPELIERRPSWPVPLRLEPLAAQEAEELLPEGLEQDLRTGIARAAGGNPLFLTEMVAMADEADGELAIPPTLQALIATRLEQLDSQERSVLERGAVEGEIFHRGAVQALAPNGQVTPKLAALVRKGLIHPYEAQLPGEDAFRFHHLLLRDAAYDALPKSIRAGLHERYADWLEDKGALVELDELLGYHLEQAATYKQDLGQPDDGLAERAGDRFAAAARRALRQGNLRTGKSLLERGLALLRPLRLDLSLELDLAHAVLDEERAASIADAAAERAAAAGDDAGAAVARAYAGARRLEAGEEDVDDVERLARAALPMLERTGDHENVVRIFSVLGDVANFHARFEEEAKAIEQALRHVRLSGQRPAHLYGLGSPLATGPRPADEALRTIDALAPPSPPPWLLLHRARLLAMLGRFDEAWSTGMSANERLRELAGNGFDMALAEIAEFAGDYAAAERFMTTFCETLEQQGSQGILSTNAPRRGRYLCVLGRHNEAEPLAQLGRELGDERDVFTQVLWRQVQALVHSSRREHDAAEELARDAVERAAASDALNLQGATVCDLSGVLATAGRIDEAAVALAQALERYERKKNLAMVAQVKPKLEDLRAHVS